MKFYLGAFTAAAAALVTLALFQNLTPATSGVNLLRNPSFQQGALYWGLSDKQYGLYIHKPTGKIEYVQVWQGTLSQTVSAYAGRTYQLQVDSQGFGEVFLTPIGAGGRPFLSQTVQLAGNRARKKVAINIDTPAGTAGLRVMFWHEDRFHAAPKLNLYSVALLDMGNSAASRNAPLAGNLIGNGGFEATTIAPWVNDRAYDPRKDFLSSDAHSGTRGAKLYAEASSPTVGSGSRLSQTIAVKPGATYEVHYFAKQVGAKTSASGAPAYMLINAPTEWYQPTELSTTAWREYVMLYRVGAGQTRMKISVTGYTHMTMIDDVSVYELVTPKPYLKTSGIQIVRADNGQRVRIAGVNWHGMETTDFLPVGLYARPWRDMVDEIANHGFNTIRLPFTLAMFKPGAVAKRVSANPELEGMPALEVMDMIIAYARTKGLRVILDCHRVTAGVGTEPLWYSAASPEATWIQAWRTLATRYGNDSTVIGADLYNEPWQAKWGGGGASDWARAAEAAGNAVLAVAPNWLIFVEGAQFTTSPPLNATENFAGVRARPIRLSVAGRVVYSPHAYAPAVETEPKAVFNSTAFPNNMPAYWDVGWGFILKQGIAPIYIGEWAYDPRGADARELKWLGKFLPYVDSFGSGVAGVHWTYWSWAFDKDNRYLFADVMFNQLDQAKLKTLAPRMWMQY